MFGLYILSSRVRLKKKTLLRPNLVHLVAESFDGADVVVRIRDERFELGEPLRVVVSGESMDEEEQRGRKKSGIQKVIYGRHLTYEDTRGTPDTRHMSNA